jgi:hypothetical protein
MSRNKIKNIKNIVLLMFWRNSLPPSEAMLIMPIATAESCNVE